MAATTQEFDVASWAAFVQGTLMGPNAFASVLLELQQGGSAVSVSLPVSRSGLHGGCDAASQLADMVAWVVSGKPPCPPLDVGELLERATAWRRVADFVGADFLAYPHAASALDFRRALPPVFAKAAHANVLRRTGAFRHPGAVADPYVGLVDLRAAAAAVDDDDDDDYGSRGGFVYGGATAALRPAAPYAPPERPFSEPRIEADIRALFDGVQWFGESNTGAGMVIAGGFVVALAHGKVALADGAVMMRPPGDIDCFVVVSGAGRTKAQIDAAADGVLASALAALERAVGRRRGGRLCVEHTGRLVNVSVLVPHGALLKIQIVRCIYETPAHVVWGFDVDACGMLYDGRSFMATTDAARALRTGVVLFDQAKMSVTGLFRYAKYIDRYGMRAFVPGVPQRVLDAAVVMAYASPLAMPAAMRVRPGRKPDPEAVEALLAARVAVADAFASMYLCTPPQQQPQQQQPPPKQHPQQQPQHPQGVFGFLLAVARRRQGQGAAEASTAADQDAPAADYSDAVVETWWQMRMNRLTQWRRRLRPQHPWISKLDAVQSAFSGAFNPIDVNVYADFCDPGLLSALIELEEHGGSMSRSRSMSRTPRPPAAAAVATGGVHDAPMRDRGRAWWWWWWWWCGPFGRMGGGK